MEGCREKKSDKIGCDALKSFVACDEQESKMVEKETVLL